VTDHVGFVGVGEMGLAMVERLLAAGQSVSFFARRPEVIEQVVALGGTASPTAAALAAAVDVMIVCLYDDHQVEAVVLGDGGVVAAMPPGSVLVLHTTGSPALTQRIADAGGPAGVRVVDAPVSGGAAAIRAGRIALFVGGDVDRCRPILGGYADRIHHVGPLGSGQKTKLVNNFLFAAHVALVREASGLLADMGVEPGPALAAIGQGSGDSAVLQIALQTGSIDSMIDLAGRFIDKDVTTAEAVAADVGAAPGMLATAARAAADAVVARRPLTVQQLWDIECIHQLKARYFRFLDSQSWGEFAGLFTDDCRHYLPDGSGTIENDAYVPMLQATLVPGVTTHHGHPPEIRLLSATEAEATWPMFDYVQVTPSSGPIAIQGYGHYLETYRKCPDGRWRISSKHNERLRVDPL
jgi:3-hydroxyisobutyrate dehydrogenase-like beta-hydroxyacid dehydrogenase